MDRHRVWLHRFRLPLLTTRTQPVSLVGGGFRTVEKLQAGDRIWRWHEGRRQEAVVAEIRPTNRTEPVFNLVVGESVIFVAGDFLVRGIPPAPAAAAP